MRLQVQKYHPENAAEWNAFVKQSVNGSFLLERDFMDYHQERFEDHSLMLYLEGQLMCCIPAHVKAGVFYSHRGLSYAGLVISAAAVSIIDRIVDALLEYVNGCAFAKAELQLPPVAYQRINKEIAAVLQYKGFISNRKLHNQSVALDQEIQVSPKKSIRYRNGKYEGLRIEVSNDFKSFWEEVLLPQLAARYHSKPVHSLAEIELLASRFPENIVQYNVYREDALLAGITFFIKGEIVKSQYTASSPEGLKTDAVAYVYMEAMKEFKEKGCSIMDYGPVNEKGGSVNKGLQRFKKQLGCQEEIWERWEFDQNI
ncbi:GNAT family N-acetyltransferase [Nonlabens sp.]|uniref:GNAT family N-acetyltransferase n=1 Tax=Nonlabens sp. TaxID=1888209 RepID=UPI001BCF8323|nr:GNAT family N-acetyltransferase [Nonlabens sp.]